MHLHLFSHYQYTVASLESVYENLPEDIVQMGNGLGKVSEPAAVSEVFGSAVQEQAAILNRWTLVVVQQTFLSDFPGFCVLQLGTGSVEKGDGGS